MLVEMFGRSIRVEPLFRRGGPVICRQTGHAEPTASQRSHELARQIAFAASVNAALADQQASGNRHKVPLCKDASNRFFKPNHTCRAQPAVIGLL